MTRQSNFELLRLISMLMVMVCHAIGYVNEIDLIGINGVAKLVVNQLCLVCVNVFVMISGWFGINASFKGVMKLLFQVWFIALLCFGVFAVLGLPISINKDLTPYLLFGHGYWFVVSYLILYVLSPILNDFSAHSEESEFRKVIIAFFVVEFIYGFVLDSGHFDYGFSPLFFIGLYLLTRYVRLFPNSLFSFSKETDLVIYIIVSVLSMLGIWFGYKWFGRGFHLNHYDSPLAVIAALYFLLFFSKLDFQCNVVNCLGSSAFAIYLIHTNSLVLPYYTSLFEFVLNNHSLIVSAGVIIVLIIIIALFCIVIDKLRILAWDLVSRCLSHN